MSVWIQKAIECLSEARKDIEDPKASIYSVFIELMSAAVQFHKESSNDRLQKIVNDGYIRSVVHCWKNDSN